MSEPFIGYGEAAQLVSKRMSPRARQLAMLERWVEGTQYDGLADWFDDVPIGDKAPCFVEPVVADSIESHVDMVLGEGRFPALTTRPAEDEQEADDGDGDIADDDEGALNGDDSAVMDTLIAGATEQARLRALCREALAMALGCGTTCVILGARAGRLFGDVVKARWCTPTFAVDGRTVEKLVIQYPYIDTYEIRPGEWAARARMYRREIDDTSDITMLPAEADVITPAWKADPKLTIQHDLGFCPVIWYPYMRGCSIVGMIDGKAPHSHILDEIRAYDVSMSQWHRAALYAGDPQWTEAGVEPGSNPSSTGKIKPTLVTKDGGKPSSDNPIVGEYHGEASGQKKGRKKHPGTVWQYENENVKVMLHTLPPGALDAIEKNTTDKRMKIMQSLAYVPLDADSTRVMRGSLSGKALESLRERQLNRDDKIREDFGDHFIKPSTSMLLRICQKMGNGIKVRGLKRAQSILDRFNQEETVPTNAVG